VPDVKKEKGRQANMNPYARLACGRGDSTLSALAARLAAWHDAMVAHERRLRAGRTDDVCDEECPHVEARALWVEALDAFGGRAHDLSFLRRRAVSKRDMRRDCVLHEHGN